MTTNRERVADVIADATVPLGTSVARGMDRAILAAEILDEAGLLMPDPPEPKWPGFWEVDGLEINRVDKDGEVLIEYESDSEYIYGMQTRSLWLNRDQVNAILAAANYAEQEHTDV